MLELTKPRRTKEQTRARWHRKAQERTHDVICFRCHTITNRIHHHCINHKYGKGYFVSVCPKCHGEINALVWNPEKHLLRGQYWGENPERLEMAKSPVKSGVFELASPEWEGHEIKPAEEIRGGNSRGVINLAIVISVKHRETGKTYFMRECSYGEMSRITGFTRNMIEDDYVGTYPLIFVAGKEYAAGFGPLSEYWIRNSKEITREMEKLEDQDQDSTDS